MPAPAAVSKKFSLAPELMGPEELGPLLAAETANKLWLSPSLPVRLGRGSCSNRPGRGAGGPLPGSEPWSRSISASESNLNMVVLMVI